MRAPGFWQRDGVLPRLLSPFSAIVAGATARRVARPGWRAPVPVICCGNVTVGGAGKTTLALDLGRRLAARGVAVHFLSRGYGGRARGPLRVDPATHDAALVGDEALLLAEIAPAWVAADRAAGARAAIAAGAGALVLDDGLQNPTLEKTFSILVIDGGTGFGNGRVMPAGPLREPIDAGAARCRAAVLIGADRTGIFPGLSQALPVLRATIAPDVDAAALSGRRVLAFAGIAHPEKFFGTVREIGADVAGTQALPDHHPYSAEECRALLQRAESLGAILVTTAKDAVRWHGALRPFLTVLGITLAWDDPPALDALLDQASG
jgi:tetraacyldisaccharide 4'-kinase